LAAQDGGFTFAYDHLQAGAGAYLQTGVALSEAIFERAKAAQAILLGAMGLPAVRYPDGREIAPQFDLRERLELYAGVRPVKSIPGLPPILADNRAGAIDFVLVRESTEGLFSARAEAVPQEDQAQDVLTITRRGSRRLFDFAFRLARRRQAQGRPGRLTCVDKANVLPSMAFFRAIFQERAALFPDVAAEASYVDAMALFMVKKPWDLDVLVTENMFGDILSDLGAGLMGGMGLAPSADIGDDHAVFQPCHGSAPDIAGKGLANPTATFLSAALMLDWLAERLAAPALAEAGQRLEAAVLAAFAAGELRPHELGGQAGTKEIHAAVAAALKG
jgi:3-isopropylmalate dehydrogenase